MIYVYSLSLSPQEVLVLIWLTSEEWKTLSTWEPLSYFELGNLVLEPLDVFVSFALWFYDFFRFPKNFGQLHLQTYKTYAKLYLTI